MDEFDNRVGVPSLLPMFVDEIMRSWDTGLAKTDKKSERKSATLTPKQTTKAKAA